MFRYFRIESRNNKYNSELCLFAIRKILRITTNVDPQLINFPVILWSIETKK